MPSVSPEQAKLMSAIDHGWQPPASMKHAPSRAVAHEFHEADKRVGKYMHAEGGKVGNLINFGKGVLHQIEGEFSNPYTADTDRLRQLISKYWQTTKPPEVKPPPVATPAPGMADGGPVEDPNATITDRFLHLIGSAADRATFDSGHHLASRALAGLTSQVAGTDTGGKTSFADRPGIVNEVLATPANISDMATGASRALLPLLNRYMGTDGGAPKMTPGTSGVSGLGLQSLRTILDRLSTAGDMAPAWSREAESSAARGLPAVRNSMGLPAPQGLLERGAEGAGVLAGQAPTGGTKATEAALTRLARLAAEWLGPVRYRGPVGTVSGVVANAPTQETSPETGNARN